MEADNPLLFGFEGYDRRSESSCEHDSSLEDIYDSDEDYGAGVSPLLDVPDAGADSGFLNNAIAKKDAGPIPGGIDTSDPYPVDTHKKAASPNVSYLGLGFLNKAKKEAGPIPGRIDTDLIDTIKNIASPVTDGESDDDCDSDEASEGETSDSSEESEEEPSVLGELWQLALMGDEDIVDFMMENDISPDITIAIESYCSCECKQVFEAPCPAYLFEEFVDVLGKKEGCGCKYYPSDSYSSDSDMPGQVKPDGKKHTISFTLLHVATALAHPWLVKYLLENGCDANAKTGIIGQTPLFAALASVAGPKEEMTAKVLEMVVALLDHGADPNLPGKALETPVGEAAGRNYCEALKLLLNSGGDPLISQIGEPLEWNEHYDNPITAAFHFKCFKCIEMLLKAGAHVNTISSEGWTLLSYAAINNMDDTVQLLLSTSKMKDLNIIGYHFTGQCGMHSAPVAYAAKGGNLKIVEMLLEAGADPNIVDKYDSLSPLHHAAKGGHVDIVKKLLAAGAKHDSATPRGFTPLQLACRKNHTDVVRELLSHGVCNTNQTYSKEARCPLLDASLHGNAEITRLLLQNGANVSRVDELGTCALWNATYAGSVDTVVELLKYNVALDQSSRGTRPKGYRLHGYSHDPASIYYEPLPPAYMACKRGWTTIVKMLVFAGAKFSMEKLEEIDKEPGRWEEPEDHRRLTEDLRDWLKKRSSEPATLMQQCRSTIRDAYPYGFKDVVEELDIPTTLKDYLLLKNL